MIYDTCFHIIQKLISFRKIKKGGTALLLFRLKGTAKHHTRRKTKATHALHRYVNFFYRLFFRVEIGGFLRQEQGLLVQV